MWHSNLDLDRKKQSRLELFAQRVNKNREEIFGGTIEENHSSGKFSTLILFINISTLYRSSQERKSRGLVVIWVAHINVGLSGLIPPIYDIVPSVTPSSGHNEVKWT